MLLHCKSFGWALMFFYFSLDYLNLYVMLYIIISTIFVYVTLFWSRIHFYYAFFLMLFFLCRYYLICDSSKICFVLSVYGVRYDAVRVSLSFAFLSNYFLVFINKKILEELSFLFFSSDKGCMWNRVKPTHFFSLILWCGSILITSIIIRNYFLLRFKHNKFCSLTSDTVIIMNSILPHHTSCFLYT